MTRAEEPQVARQPPAGDDAGRAGAETSREAIGLADEAQSLGPGSASHFAVVGPESAPAAQGQSIPADLLRQLGVSPGAVGSVQVLSAFQAGPLPPAHELRALGEVVPGLPEQLLENYLKEGRHRRTMDRRAIGLAQFDAKKHHEAYARGQYLAFSLGCAIICLAGLALFRGHPVTAGILVGSIAGAGGVFFWAQRRRDKSGASNPPPEGDEGEDEGADGSP